MKTHIYFYAEASKQIGTGHVQRCLALAQALRTHGARCTFLIREQTDDLTAQLIQPMFPLYVSPPDSLPGKGIPEPSSSILIVDSYEISADALLQMKKTGLSLVVIDDFARLPFYPCDLIINQNLFADTLSYPAYEQTRVLRGPQYALLRPEFILRRQSLQRTYPVTARRMLVTMGGADPHQGTFRVLRAIHQLDDSLKEQTRTIVILGKGFTHRDITSGSFHLPKNAQLVHHTDRMSTWMASADLAVCAGGSTVYELAALGVPSLILAITDHQTAVGESLQKRGAAVYLGSIQSLSVSEICAAIHRLILHQPWRRQLSRQAFQLVDARGAERVANIILKELMPH